MYFVAKIRHFLFFKLLCFKKNVEKNMSSKDYILRIVFNFCHPVNVIYKMENILFLFMPVIHITVN